MQAGHKLFEAHIESNLAEACLRVSSYLSIIRHSLLAHQNVPKPHLHPSVLHANSTFLIPTPHEPQKFTQTPRWATPR